MATKKKVPSSPDGTLTPGQRMDRLEAQVSRLLSFMNLTMGGIAVVAALATTLIALLPKAGKDGAPGTPGISVPVGTVVAWPGPLPPIADNDEWHRSWKPCDGNEIEKALVSPELVTAIGNTYGDASTGRIKLPNFQGRFLRGAGGNSLPLGSPQADAVGNHQHGDVLRSARGVHGNSYNDKGGAAGTSDCNSTGDNNGKLTDSTLPNEPETRPQNYAVHWIIRVK